MGEEVKRKKERKKVEVYSISLFNSVSCLSFSLTVPVSVSLSISLCHITKFHLANSTEPYYVLRYSSSFHSKFTARKSYVSVTQTKWTSVSVSACVSVCVCVYNVHVDVCGVTIVLNSPQNELSISITDFPSQKRDREREKRTIIHYILYTMYLYIMLHCSWKFWDSFGVFMWHSHLALLWN